MKTKLFFTLLFFLVLVSHARISTQRPRTIKDALNRSAASMTLQGSGAASSTSNPPARDPELSRAFGRLPLSFEINQGQTDPQVQFLSRGNGYALFLTNTEAVMQLPIGDLRLPIVDRKLRGALGPSRFSNPHSPIRNPQSALSIADFRLPIFDWRRTGSPTAGFVNPQSEIRSPQFRALRMKLIGSNPHPQIEGLDRLPGICNYFIGNDPKKWRTNVPNYARVCYREVYPGIDLVYYGKQGQLEYDWVVAPGADLQAIQLAFEGADGLRLDDGGDLVIQAGGIEVRQKRPLFYQAVDGRRQMVPGEYQISGHRVSFEVNEYDVAQTLVIDPAVQVITELGGTLPTDASSLAVDSAGQVYVAGTAYSVEFPAMAGTPPPPPDGSTGKAFIAKLNPQGDGLLYSTFLGGSGLLDHGQSVAVNSAGQAFISGYTGSADFPTTPGAFQTALRGVADIFVAKLSSEGNSVLYSTLLGGTGPDVDSKVSIDSSGNAYVTGTAGSPDFPTTPGAYQTKFGGGDSDAFVTKLNASGSALIYSTFLGGGGSSTGDEAHWIAVDGSGSVYVAGSTTSSNFPITPGAFQTSRVEFENDFVAKINPSGTGLIFSTYLSSSQRQYNIFAMVVDSAGNVIVTGSTSASNSAGYHTTKLNPTGTGLVYSVLDVGGSALALDAAQNVYVAAQSTYLPVVQSVVTDRIVRLDAAGQNRVTLSLGDLRSVPWLQIKDMAIGTTNQIYLAGVANSSPRIGPGGSLQINYAVANGFVARLPGAGTQRADIFVPIVLSSSGANNSFYTSELTLTNRGSTDADLLFTYTAAIGPGSGTASDTLPTGRQRIIPDTIAYLRSVGIPIPESGSQGGTLRVSFSGISSVEAVAATVRTTTALANGRTGLAYSGIAAGAEQIRLFKAASGIVTTDLGMPPHNGLTTSCYVPGLRQNSTDRSNVAIQNAGTADDGNVTLRLTVFSGSSQAPGSIALPDVTLPPGGFKQFNAILATSGLAVAQGYVRVDRVSGKAPFYAYGVVNDQVTSDGTFLAPVPEQALHGETELILPAVVETPAFTSELVLTNWSSVRKTLNFALGQNVANRATDFVLSLNSGEQIILPDFVQWLRDHGVANIGVKGGTYVSTLMATVDSGDASGLFMGSRTTTAGGGGKLGVAYPAVPYDQVNAITAWVYGLQQNAENRSNLAVVNSAGFGHDIFDCCEDMFRIELFDGDTGLKVGSIDSITINLGEWKQFDNILSQYAPGTTQGYALITHTAGNNPFIAYAVINDGGQASGLATGRSSRACRELSQW